MMPIRVLLCAALVGVVEPATAQTWLTTPCIDSARPLYAVPTTAPKPICLPAPAGAGTALIVEVNDFGTSAGWWCKRSGKDPALYLYAVRWEAVTPALVMDLALGALSSSKTTAIQSVQAKHQTDDIRDMCDVWGPMAPRLLAVRP